MGVYCVKLNFKISKSAYCNSQNVREYLNDDPHGITIHTNRDQILESVYGLSFLL